MAQMKHNAIVCNIGHFDNEIDMAGLARSGRHEDGDQAPGTDLWTFPDGHSIIVLAEGRAGEPRLRHRAPELRDELLVLQPGDRPGASCSRQHRSVPDRASYVPAQAPRREGGALHLERSASRSTRLTDEQAEYLGVDPGGPFKAEHYRY